MSEPADSVTGFIDELQKEGVFAKAVDSAGVAFHSPYMSEPALALKKRLQQVYFLAVLVPNSGLSIIAWKGAGVPGALKRAG